MSKTLTLPLKRLYFEQIRDGSKVEEFRLATPYWKKRLEGRSYDGIVLTLGYPKSGDHERRLERPWKGFRKTFIRHPLFGPEPVEVYAINVRDPSDRRGRAKTFFTQPLPEPEWRRCEWCNGTGYVTTERDLHRSAGTVPCPRQGCHKGTIKSRKVETYHD